MPTINENDEVDYTEEEIETHIEIGESFLENLVEESIEHDFDLASVCFTLFINCIGILTSAGWNKEELMKEVDYYVDAADDKKVIN